MSVLDEAIILNNGSLIPKLGLNVEPETDLAQALHLGYRLFSVQGAQMASLKKAVQSSHILLPQIYLQLNLSASLSGQDIASYISEQLQLLGTNCLNLVLLPQNDDNKQNISNWRILEKLQKQGRIKSIGVTNFYQDNLQALIAEAQLKPVVNHLNVASPELLSYLQQENILLEQDQLPSDLDKISDLAEQQKIKPEQLLLKYNLQGRKITLISGDSDLEIERNLAFPMSSEQKAQITTALNK